MIDNLTKVRIEAKKEQYLRELSRRHLIDFTQYFKNDYEANWHHNLIAEYLEAVERREINRLMIFMPPRHGKNIMTQTPVLSSNGWTKHGDLKPGDFVFGINGNPIKVLAISPKIKTNRRITFTNGETIDCHENHEWTVYDRAYGQWKTYETKYFLKTTKFKKKKQVWSSGRAMYQLPFRNPIQFEEKKLPMNSYVLGAWLGDGTSTAPCITGDAKDFQITDKIKEYYSISSVNIHKTTGCLRTNFGSGSTKKSIFGNHLRSIGVFKNKHIPNIYKFSSINQRLNLLAGLIDTDGHVDKKSRVRIVTASKILAGDIKEVAISLGWDAYIMKQQPSLSTSGIQGKKIVYTVGFNPTYNIPTQLPRKKIKRFPQKRMIGIKSINEIDGEMGNCIQVDSPDGLYLVGKSLIPTHNSELASVHFPAWYLGKHPNHEIIATSYSAELSAEFGRKVRMIADTKSFTNIFPEAVLDTSTRAADNWHLKDGGGYLCTGVGGSITGRGANILLIDDPMKGRKEANSPLIRNMTWEWYRGTAYSRLMSRGAIILIQCMTGDTPVLMEDKTEKLLKDIRIGDRVATYDNGKLSSSIVKNWISNGNDYTFTIKTKSGKILKANERHPFLIYNEGKLQWIRVKNLLLHQHIVIVKDKEVNGKVKSVFGKDVNNQLDAKDIAHITIIKKVGQVVIDRLQRAKNHVVVRILNIVMGLLLRSIMNLTKDKEVNAQFVNNRQEIMYAPIGEENSASTTATKQIKLGDCFAMTAIWRSVIQRLKKQRWLLQNTSDFTLDKIVSIEPSRIEEVFDLQIEGTENFIADGVVSHNTRWHDMDLAGMILNSRAASYWTVLELPAMAIKDEVIKGKFIRKKGGALWPERYPIKVLEDIKRNIDNYEWACQYMQNPVNEETMEFYKENFKYRSETEVSKLLTRRFLTVDTQGKLNPDPRVQSNYIGFCDNRVDREGMWNFRAWKSNMNPGDLVDYLFALQQKYRFEKIGIEKTMLLDGLEPYIEKKIIEMQKEGFIFPYVPLRHKGNSKELRIRGLLPYYRNGKIYHVEGECDELESQLLRFPSTDDDDVMDACFVGDTLVATQYGNKKIKDIKIGEKVITPSGLKRVLWSGQTGYKKIINKCSLIATPDHSIFTFDNGFVRLDTLDYNNHISYLSLSNLLIWAYKKVLFLMENNMFSGKQGIIDVSRLSIKKGMIWDYMFRFGNFIIKRKFQKVLSFTIKILMCLIMILKIWSVYLIANILKYILNIIKKIGLKILIKLDRLLLNGTDRKRVENGIENMSLIHFLSENLKKFALTVAKSIVHFPLIVDFAAENVKINLGQEKEDYQELTMSKENARYAEKNSLLTSTYQTNVVPEFVVQNLDTGIEPVYNITVEDDHVYFANGILVGNCAYQLQIAESPLGWKDDDFEATVDKYGDPILPGSREMARAGGFDPHNPMGEI